MSGGVDVHPGRRSRLGPLLVVTVIGCASSSTLDVGRVPPDVALSTRIIEYPVTAASVTELRSEMRRAGPEVDGRRFAGSTHWNVRWNYEYDRRGLSARLLEHERGHVRLTLDAAREIAEAIRPMANGSCSALGEQANARGRLILSQLEQRQLAYDPGTRHGAVQRPDTSRY